MRNSDTKQFRARVCEARNVYTNGITGPEAASPAEALTLLLEDTCDMIGSLFRDFRHYGKHHQGKP